MHASHAAALAQCADTTAARSPRFAAPLVRQLEDWGGVSWIFLTHRDDVADAAKWAAHFSAARVIHADDADAAGGASSIEHSLRGSGPWALPHDASHPPREAQPGDDALVLHTPGHTRGSCCLLHKPSRALFSGDHLAFAPGLARLTIFRRFNWHSVATQLASVRLLMSYDFVHLLPGHGRRVAFASAEAKDAALAHLLAEEGDADDTSAR